MTSGRSRPIVTVDAALFTIVDGALHLALIERAAEPFRGRMALIGGYLHTDEDQNLAAAVDRILREKADLTGIFVEQLMTFGARSATPAVGRYRWPFTPWRRIKPFWRLRPRVDLTLVRVDRLPDLPFDHAQIVAAALSRLRNKASYSSLPTFLLPAEFTFPELKTVYEIVMGTALNDSAFRRKISDMKIIEEVPEAKSPPSAQRRRPAQLYRRSSHALVEFDRTV